MKYFVIFLVLVGFAGTAWAEVTLSAEPASAKFGDDIIIHASVSSYDDALRYYIDVINPTGQQIDSTLWFVREDFNYTMRTVHPAYQILRGGEFTIQAEQAINNIERTGNIVQTTSFFLSNPPPLYQLKGGIVPENVICNDELVLLQKYDGSPACVTEQTKQKLIERGWATCDGEIFYGRGHPCGVRSSQGMSSSSPEIMSIDVIKDGKIFDVKYLIKGAMIQEMIFSNYTNSLAITIDVTREGDLEVTIPRNLLDAKMDYCPPRQTNAPDDRFFVMLDGEEIFDDEILTTVEARTLKIPFDINSEKIEIIGTCFV